MAEISHAEISDKLRLLRRRPTAHRRPLPARPVESLRSSFAGPSPSDGGSSCSSDAAVIDLFRSSIAPTPSWLDAPKACQERAAVVERPSSIERAFDPDARASAQQRVSRPTGVFQPAPRAVSVGPSHHAETGSRGFVSERRTPSAEPLSRQRAGELCPCSSTADQFPANTRMCEEFSAESAWEPLSMSANGFLPPGEGFPGESRSLATPQRLPLRFQMVPRLAQGSEENLTSPRSVVHTPKSSASPIAGRHGPISRERRSDEGGTPQYLSYDELPPFEREPQERLVVDAIKRLAGGVDWSAQFAAIDDVRRLSRYAPRVFAELGGRLHEATALVAALADSLRSALAKNGLRCISELFVTFRGKMDAEIEVCLSVSLRRAVDTNGFISEEAEIALCDMCQSATEAKLLAPISTAATHRRPEIRSRALWCAAMLAQRSQSQGCKAGPQVLRQLAPVVVESLRHANSEVRGFARVAAVALCAAGDSGDSVLERHASTLRAAVPPSIDFLSFNAFDLDDVQRCTELTRTASGATRRAPIAVRHGSDTNLSRDAVGSTSSLPGRKSGRVGGATSPVCASRYGR